MKIEYERTARHSYMLVSDTGCYGEDYELPMIRNNSISGLLGLSVMNDRDGTVYCYNITGLTPLDKLVSMNPVDKEFFKAIITGICNLKINLEEYLLDDKNILLKIEHIFYDRNKKSLLFCYIPGLKEDIRTGWISLMEILLKAIDHTDQSAVGMAYQIYEKCASDEVVTEEFISIISQCDSQDNNENIRVDENPDTTDMTDKTIKFNDYTDILDEYIKSSESNEDRKKSLQLKRAQKKAEKIARKKEKKDQKNRKKVRFWNRGVETEKADAYALPEKINYAFSDETTMLSDRVAESLTYSDETVCLNSEQLRPQWYLKYLGDGLESDIRLSYFPFSVGKGSDTDFRMVSATISRYHARIIESTDGLEIEDINSTNGTYVNGKLVPMNKSVKISEGDSIVFATEKYELRR